MPPKLGILAGGGDLPVKLADACRSSGRDVVIIAIKDHADPEIMNSQLGDLPVHWNRLGALDATLKVLRDEGVEEVVMAGRVRRPSLRELKPDLRALKFLTKLARQGIRSLGDDGLLRALIAELEESEGLKVIGAGEVFGELLMPVGPLGKHRPNHRARNDIKRGVEVSCVLGRLDIGQAVVVQEGIVLGVEAIEGTDELLQRCAAHRRVGHGGVLVKLSKPDQERRADLPTIGPRTVEYAAEAALAGIAVEGEGALVLNRDEVVETADRLGLFVVGLSAEEMAGR